MFPNFDGQRGGSPYLHIKPRPKRTWLKMSLAFAVGAASAVALVRHQPALPGAVEKPTPMQAAQTVSPQPKPTEASTTPAPVKRAPETAGQGPAAPPLPTPRSHMAGRERPAVAMTPIGAPALSMSEPAPEAAPAATPAPQPQAQPHPSPTPVHEAAHQPDPPAVEAPAHAPAVAPQQTPAAPASVSTTTEPQVQPASKPRARVAKRKSRSDEPMETLVRVPGRVTADGRPVYRRLRAGDDGDYVLNANDEVAPLGGGRFAGYR
jgi:hypothetical protein